MIWSNTTRVTKPAFVSHPSIIFMWEILPLGTLGIWGFPKTRPTAQRPATQGRLQGLRPSGLAAHAHGKILNWTTGCEL